MIHVAVGVFVVALVAESSAVSSVNSPVATSKASSYNLPVHGLPEPVSAFRHCAESDLNREVSQFINEL